MQLDHSHPTSAEVKNAWRYTSILQHVFMAWCLVEHREKFTFILHYLGNRIDVPSAFSVGVKTDIKQWDVNERIKTKLY
jgi:hypothetical protein